MFLGYFIKKTFQSSHPVASDIALYSSGSRLGAEQEIILLSTVIYSKALFIEQTLLKYSKTSVYLTMTAFQEQQKQEGVFFSFFINRCTAIEFTKEEKKNYTYLSSLMQQSFLSVYYRTYGIIYAVSEVKEKFDRLTLALTGK